MRKFILFFAIGTAMILGCCSCKNAKMHCWEYTIVYEDDSETGYMWDTRDYMDYVVACEKKLGEAVMTYEKASKYKTAEDCLDANKLMNN